MAVQVAFVNIATGEIQQWASPRVDTDFLDGGLYNGLLAFHMPSDRNIREFAKINVYKNGSWTTREEKPDNFHLWDGDSWVFQEEQFIKAFRGERNLRLAQCDWTQVVDAPLTAEKKEEWRLYRQALRDLPEINEATTLEDIAWPSQP